MSTAEGVVMGTPTQMHTSIVFLLPIGFNRKHLLNIGLRTKYCLHVLFPEEYKD